jgi:hypothetical protein
MTKFLVDLHFSRYYEIEAKDEKEAFKIANRKAIEYIMKNKKDFSDDWSIEIVDKHTEYDNHTYERI